MTSDNKYTITYFDSPGRAETSRLALSAVGVKFNDVRVTSEEWQKMKAKTPQGQLPMMVVEMPGGNLTIPQSGAMVRFIAREHGLYGANSSENAMVDVVLDTNADMFGEIIKLYIEKDDKKKAEIKEKLEKEIVPKFVNIFAEMRKTNSKEKWLVGSKMTVADIAVFSFFKQLPVMFGDSLVKAYTDNESMQTHVKAVLANPGIKKWVDAHPPKKNN